MLRTLNASFFRSSRPAFAAGGARRGPFALSQRFSSSKKFPEERLFQSADTEALEDFQFDVHEPGHSFLEKSYNNPNEPVILLPNLLSNKKNYSVEANDIAQTLETNVYAVNLRNHFSGTPHKLEFARPFDLNALVNDLVLFAKKQGFSRVIVLGDGLGGKVGLLASLLRQSDIEIAKLVVLDSLPEDLPAKATREVTTWVDALAYVVDESGIEKDDKEFLEKANGVLAEKFGIADSLTRRYLLNNITDQAVNLDKVRDFAYLEPKVPLGLLKESLLPSYFQWPKDQTKGKTTETPVLFLVGRHSAHTGQGDKSVYESVAAKNSIKKQFPNSEVKTFNADHFVFSQQSTHVTNAVCQFLLRDHNPEYDRARGQEAQK